MTSWVDEYHFLKVKHLLSLTLSLERTKADFYKDLSRNLYPICGKCFHHFSLEAFPSVLSIVLNIPHNTRSSCDKLLHVLFRCVLAVTHSLSHAHNFTKSPSDFHTILHINNTHFLDSMILFVYKINILQNTFYY